MLKETDVKTIFDCTDCGHRVYKPHSSEECNEYIAKRAASDQAYQAIDFARQNADYVTLTTQALHRMLREAFLSGYKQAKEKK